MLRSSITDALQSDYVRTARAKGLSERTRAACATRCATRAGAALSMGGLQIGLMFAGVIVVEVVYNWPGIGLYTYQSINRADLPAIAGVTVLLGAVYVIDQRGRRHPPGRRRSAHRARRSGAVHSP